LFVSIHANSHRQPAVSGIETYFLNFASTPDAEAVAARENAASVQTMGTLPAIVKAIALNNKLEESREFAVLLQGSLVKRTRSQSSTARDLGVKQAPFVVLIRRADAVRADRDCVPDEQDRGGTSQATRPSAADRAGAPGRDREISGLAETRQRLDRPLALTQ
jgi:N-acetylmuramoyl-L-alanine amidase